MLRIAPFPAIRPEPGVAARVASVPYDVVNTEEARSLAEGNQLSFLHVVRPEIDLPEGTDPYAPEVYRTARANLDRLLAEGALARDTEPRLYLYRQAMAHRTQVGLVCCCHVDDYLENRIRKHEHTRPDKEDDRTRHVLALNANAGPVFLTYRDDAAIDELAVHDQNARPLYHFNAPDGVTHTVWTVEDPAPYVEAFRGVPHVYVADGHHRAASAARAGVERRAANPNHTADEPYNWFLTVLFPASQLSILPYDRLLRDLGALTPDAARARLAEVGTLRDTDEPRPDRPGSFGILLGDRWSRLDLDPAGIDASDPVGSLDAALLQSRVLAPIFGIGDPRTDPRLDFVGGIRGIPELEQRIRSGSAAAAFALHPTSIEELMAVSDAGLVMPPKSTWFEPKLRSGLFVHEI